MSLADYICCVCTRTERLCRCGGVFVPLTAPVAEKRAVRQATLDAEADRCANARREAREESGLYGYLLRRGWVDPP